MFELSPGQLERALVTLPCPLFSAHAVFTPDDSGTLALEPYWKVKARLAAQTTLAAHGLEHKGGRLVVKSEIPIRWGLGSSTSDVIATIIAVADAFSLLLQPEQIASLAVDAEAASDSLMFGDRTVLFAHRRGYVVEELGGPLPPLDVLGFNTDPTGKGVDTVEFAPARYNRSEIEMLQPLPGLLRRALREGDPRGVGRVATASARINQRHLPIPRFDALLALAETVHSVGLQVAHSGTVVGLLFDANDARKSAGIQKARTLLRESGIEQTWHFRT
ncbi:hypothetical protein [Cystobacter fuscus]|uniref:GHMP family kinase ATP-binding protein n=1 Tax=Cystobacter fuscus TaxID=43 RepID=UPI0018DF20F8|nr:hypothetical protein [Cystobacter fuscus]